VSLDVDTMEPGERIQDFIERSIRDSDVVVSIVSTRSLLSRWVAVETINTFHRRKWDGKLFIGACDLFIRARDLFVSVRRLFVRARDQDVLRIGLFQVQRGIH
jgi:hypothetical protein